MIGAGFSKNVISLAENSVSPNWEELAKKMYELLYPVPEKNEDKTKWKENMIKKTSGRNILKLAEEFKVVFGRNKLDQFIEENIDDNKYIPGDLHIKLLELNWNDVFTTNYDTLLERAINNISVRKNYKIILTQNDLPGSTHPRIIKLHGSIPNIKPYIMCEEDYRTYPVKYAPFVNTVQQSMLETQLCLIGFSGDDPNFLNWLGWLRDNMGDSCPRIYLCGVFSDMSESEKEMLKSQNIMVLNLECLIDGKSSNPHYEALNKFLEKLKSYGEEQRSIFTIIPYMHRLSTDKIDYKYYDDLIEYTNEVKAKISDYVALPFTELKEFSDELYRQFKKLSELKNDINKFVLMGNFVFIFRRLYIPLYDYEAKEIKRIIQEFPFKELSENDKFYNYRSIWFELSMYLAEMYRIDGEIKEYSEIMKNIELELPYIYIQQKADYYIEKSKFSISQFDYSGALKYIEKIDESISYEVQIKKACLLSQIGEDNKALDLLKKCSASLAQRSYSEDKTASLTSYMNICARSLNLYKNLDEFSDQDFIDNKYNVRKIFNDAKLRLSNSLFLAENKKDREKSSFNPNSRTITYGTTPREVTNAVEDSFKYLLLQDRFCLPVRYSDHTELTARAVIELIPTSKNPLWKWSYIIRTNDNKIIENFFSRELIVTSNNEWLEKLFDELIFLLKSFQKYDDYGKVKRILTQKTIYEVLSRVCIVLDNERILKLLEKIFEIIPQINKIYNSHIHGILKRLSYCFNSEILERLLVKIFELPGSDICITNYFYDIKIDSIKTEIPEELISRVIQEIRDTNIKIRDNGISKIVLLNRYKGLSKYYELISKAIWDRKNEYGFPESEIYSITIWETLPHDVDISFKDLYVNYLKNPNFPRCVDGNMIHGYTNNDWLIHQYINCFYILSDFGENHANKITWNIEIINSILAYIYGYLDNEKKIFQYRFDIFGYVEETKRRFTRLSNLVAMLLTQASISNCYDENGQEWVAKIKTLFKETEISILSIDITERLMNNEYDSIYEMIVKQMMSRSAEDISQAFTALDIVLVYKESNDNNIGIEEELIGFFKSLRYMDISNSRPILLYLSQIIDRKLFLTDKFKRVIIQSFKECLDIYEIAIKDINKDYLDSIFNLSNLARKYYKALIDNNLEIPDEMYSLMNMFKKSPLNEVKNTWI